MERLELKHYATRDEVAGPQWEQAMEASVKFLAKKIAKMDCGEAMAEGNFGMPAAEHFVFEAFAKLYKGEWEWSQHRALHTQIIRIALSDIHHYLESYKDKEHPETVEIDERLADHLADDEDFKDVVYEIAEQAAAGDKLLLEYLKKVREVNNYEVIAEDMGLSITEVYQLQRKLVRRLQKRKTK